jgi:hypothetical protein
MRLDPGMLYQDSQIFIVKIFDMLRKYKHIREMNKFLDLLLVDQVNLTIYASRFGWNDDIQHQLTNSALLIRKYQRRLRLIQM